MLSNVPVVPRSDSSLKGASVFGNGRFAGSTDKTADAEGFERGPTENTDDALPARTSPKREKPPPPPETAVPRLSHAPFSFAFRVANNSFTISSRSLGSKALPPGTPPVRETDE